MSLSPNFIIRTESRRNKKGWTLAPEEESRHMCKILVCKLLRERKPGRLRLKYERNIKMYLKAAGCEGLDWVSMTRDGKLWRIFCNYSNELPGYVKQ